MDTNLKHTLQSVVDKCKLIFQPVTTNGYAELNEYGYVKTSQLPGFVDDIIEGYYNSIDGKFYTTESYTSEIIPEGGKIYVSIDSNKTYRWSSSSYVVISETIALGETGSTAFAGDKGKANSEAITTLQTSILNKLDKTMNLSDVQNRQIAADNLLNASPSNAEKFLYVNANGNVDFIERLAINAGVYSNEVSSHGHRHDYYNSQKPYGPIMKFRHLNNMHKFQIDFTIMSVDTTASTNPSFIAKYTFFRTAAFSPEGKLVCNYYSTTNKEGFSYEDVIAVPSVEDGVHYTTFYKKTKSEYDWYCYIIHSISKYSIDGLSGYIVPTYYIGAPRDIPAKIAEVALDSTMYKNVSDFSEIWRPIQTEYSQHIFGKYNNVEDEYEQNYIEIVGNGTDENTRSNARTLDWQGNEVLAGTITANGINLNEEINLKEPLLPATPTQPESKFLNANKQWVEISAGSGMTNPMTTAGDIIYGSATGTPTRLPIGTEGQVLKTVSGNPAWTDCVTPSFTEMYYRYYGETAQSLNMWSDTDALMNDRFGNPTSANSGYQNSMVTTQGAVNLVHNVSEIEYSVKFRPYNATGTNYSAGSTINIKLTVHFVRTNYNNREVVDTITFTVSHVLNQSLNTGQAANVQDYVSKTGTIALAAGLTAGDIIGTSVTISDAADWKAVGNFWLTCKYNE